MTYDPRIHHRRSIRLRGHDYGGGGAYFVTCCVEGKECLFGRVVEATMLFNECGQVVQQAWEGIPQRFPSMILDAFQVMPNHLHGILVIPGPGLEPSLAAAAVIHPHRPGQALALNADAGAQVFVGPGLAPASARPNPKAGASHREDRPRLGDVMGAFKSISTIAVNRLLSRRGRLLQEDYFEHVIRDVDSLEKIRDYIRTNPGRWLEDAENPDRQPVNKSSDESDWLRSL